MKGLLLVLLSVGLFGGSIFNIDEQKVRESNIKYIMKNTESICINGYVYVIYTSTYGATMVQAYEKSSWGKCSTPQPISCKD